MLDWIQVLLPYTLLQSESDFIKQAENQIKLGARKYFHNFEQNELGTYEEYLKTNTLRQQKQSDINIDNYNNNNNNNDDALNDQQDNNDQQNESLDKQLKDQKELDTLA